MVSASRNAIASAFLLWTAACATRPHQNGQLSPAAREAPPGGCVAPAIAPGRAGGAYDSSEVALTVAVSPKYRMPLWRGEPGEVVARFVVDTTGRMDATTLTIVRASGPEVTAFVLQELPRFIFLPAEIVGGCMVRQWVDMPFSFTRVPG